MKKKNRPSLLPPAFHTDARFSMLEQLFAGDPGGELRPPRLTVAQNICQNAAKKTSFKSSFRLSTHYKHTVNLRIEAQLESTQPEEQHGFRTGKRVEEYLVTTRMLFDKLLRANLRIWIISLDLSKAFGRVSWPALWPALSQLALSNQIWMLQNFYRNREGRVFANDVCSRLFRIRGGVRQGCVLSHRLFNSVLEMAMACWRSSVENLGLDLCNGGPALLDIRFADDIFTMS